MNNLTRRNFLTLAGTAVAGAALLPRARATEKKKQSFEVSASLYAWDLHDEGVERVLDNLQEMAAVNSVYLLGVMHPEMRPVGGGVFPHNPVRQTWMAEDARCYWHPDVKRYGRVKSRLSDHAWLSDTDGTCLATKYSLSIPTPTAKQKHGKQNKTVLRHSR